MHPSSLAGKVILVTRAADADPKIRWLLEERGARVVSLPAIEIVEPSSTTTLDEAIRELGRYDGVLFTSRNAVEYFLRRLAAVDPTRTATLASQRIYAVGEKTEERLREANIPVSVVPRKFSAADLADLLKRDGVWGRRYLFPKSNIARDTIPNHIRSLGGTVDEVIAYENRPPRDADVEPIRRALLNGTVDATAFFSPSAVVNTVDLVGAAALSRTAIAVIGPTTREAVREAGLRVSAMAAIATAEGLVEALEKKLQKKVHR